MLAPRIAVEVFLITLPGFGGAVDYSQEKYLDFSYFFRYYYLAQLRAEWALAQFQALALNCALLF
jgi:hypothetical protein